MANAQLSGADRHPLHSDTELVQRWLRNQKRAGKWFGDPLWRAVSDVFGVGQRSAKDICKRHGFDPDVLVKWP